MSVRIDLASVPVSSPLGRASSNLDGRTRPAVAAIASIATTFGLTESAWPMLLAARATPASRAAAEWLRPRVLATANRHCNGVGPVSSAARAQNERPSGAQLYVSSMI